MKIINTILFALIAMLIFVMIAKGEVITKSEADSDYISWVKIYTGGYISDTNIQPMLNDLRVVRGVAKVDVEPENRLLIVTPEKDEKLNLKYIQKAIQRFERSPIDRGKNFSPYSNKVEIAAQGNLAKVPVAYSFSLAERIRDTYDKYKFQVGDTEFILSQNGKLNELIKSGYNKVRIEGTISAFTNRKPIMVVTNFEPINQNGKSLLVSGIENSKQFRTENAAKNGCTEADKMYTYDIDNCIEVCQSKK